LTIFKLLSRPIGGEPVFRVAATRKVVADEREQAAGLFDKTSRSDF
jgi:hypothetical protein